MENFLGKRMLVVTAHPDDESYMAGGTIYQNYQRGGETFLLCASHGEKGTSHLTEDISTERLKQIRADELQKSAGVLHISQHQILGLSDGSLKDHAAEIRNGITEFAKAIQPEIILSFGQDGISGHLDHITVGETAQSVAHQLGVPFVAAAFPPRIAKQAIAYLKTRRKAGHYARDIQYAAPNFTIEIDPEKKKEALRAHRSQMDGDDAFTGFPNFAVKELMQREHFVVHYF